MEGIVDNIKKLKKEKNAVILAHYYTLPEIQQVADFVGDSLALSQAAAETDADVIVFAGVKFMAETASILCPDKVVLLPDLEAGCSLADSCPAREFAEFRAKYPDHIVVAYVNTTAEVKALTDVCCTSSNAMKIIDSIDADKPILFAPDRNLGDYLRRQSGRQNMVLWDGACHVHEQFSVERIIELKKEYPSAPVIAHPECKATVLALADFVGSTAALLEYTERSDSEQFIVATESGILYEMQLKSPTKHFIPAPPSDSTCGCSDCEYMKLITLEKIVGCLAEMSPEIKVDKATADCARGAIERMLKI